MSYGTAREFFDAVLEASRDVERIRRQLDAMHERAALPASRQGPRSRTVGGRSSDRLGEAVVTMVTAEKHLEQRLEADYSMLDAATATLYGTDLDKGLCSFVAPWVADAMYQHYVNGLSWPSVARMVGYERRYMMGKVSAAFKIMDMNGMAATVAGGLAARDGKGGPSRWTRGTGGTRARMIAPRPPRQRTSASC